MAEVELKGNSFKEKGQEPGEDKKKFTKVTQTSAVIGEKKGLKKVVALLAPAETGRDIKNDVVIPAVRNVISDICGGFFDTIEDSINAMLFPGSERRRRRGRDDYIPYGSYYRYGPDRRDDRRDNYARPSRSGFDLSEVVFKSRGEAEIVLYAMDEAVSRYGVVSVGDFYDLAGISTTNIPHTSYKYGWVDIRNASIAPTRGGFCVRFPRYSPID